MTFSQRQQTMATNHALNNSIKALEATFATDGGSVVSSLNSSAVVLAAQYTAVKLYRPCLSVLMMALDVSNWTRRGTRVSVSPPEQAINRICAVAERFRTYFGSAVGAIEPPSPQSYIALQRRTTNSRQEASHPATKGVT